MGVFRGIRYGNLLVPPSGQVDIPGGLVARLGSGAPGVTLTFPIVGVYDDGQLTPIMFMDTGPTPLYEEKVDFGGRGFPKVTLTGLTPGTSVAYQVAQSEQAARYMAAGGQLATDSSGRLVVVTPSGVALAVSLLPSAASTGAASIANVGESVALALAGQQWATAKLTVVLGALLQNSFEYSDDGGTNYKFAPYARKISAVNANPSVLSISSYGGLATGDVYEIPLPANCTHVRIRRAVGAGAESFTISGGQPYVPGMVVSAVLYDVTSGVNAVNDTGVLDVSGWKELSHTMTTPAGGGGLIAAVDDNGANLASYITPTAGAALEGGIGGAAPIAGVNAASVAAAAALPVPMPKRINYHQNAVAALTSRIRIEARR